MDEKQKNALKRWKKLFLLTLVLFYGGTMALGFFFMPKDLEALTLVKSELPLHVYWSIEAGIFIQSYWWAISGFMGGLGFLGWIGLMGRTVKPLIAVNVLGMVLSATGSYLANNAVEIAAENAKERGIEEIKDRALDHLKEK